MLLALLAWGAAFVLVWYALLLALRLFPPVAPDAGGVGRNDLPWRMLAAAAPVLGVTRGCAGTTVQPRALRFL
ncbi:MAG: hypothetical protein V7631_1056 [Massilia sp.]|jgi:hypothetical protein